MSDMSPQEREQLLARATAAHRQGKYADADKLYRELLDFDPDQFDAMHRLGILKLHEGAYGQTKDLLERLSPGSPALPPLNLTLAPCS
jgi:thioredoxin-like negative regulator of GroEL